MVRRQEQATHAQPDCIFCQILAGDLPGTFLYRDDYCAAFMDIQPVNPGHILVVPREHYESLVDIPPGVARHLFEVALRLGPIVRRLTQSDGMNVIVNSGVAAGQDVFHCHAHVIPRRAGDGFEVTLPFPGSNQPDRTQLDAMAARIIGELRDPARPTGPA